VIAELFLVGALSLPSTHHFWPAIGSHQMAGGGEVERLKEWIRKNNPDAEVFIHPNPQEEKLKENGWERVPFTWRGNKIWIQRKPVSDQKKQRRIEASA